MGWSIYTHASIGDIRRPRPLGSCDRCGFIYNRDRLHWQYDWAGVKEMNQGILVCQKCMDDPQFQLKNIKIPIDPLPIQEPRPGEFSGMTTSSSPGVFDTIVPSQIVVETVDTANVPQANIGDRLPIVTETSSMPLLTEVTVTPYPSGTGDDTYTREGSTL